MAYARSRFSHDVAQFIHLELRGGVKTRNYGGKKHLITHMYMHKAEFHMMWLKYFEMLIEIRVICFRAATVFEATALCKYGPESSLSKNTTLHGIGKDAGLLYRKVPKFWDA